MICPHCRTDTPVDTGLCVACSGDLSASMAPGGTGEVEATAPSDDATRTATVTVGLVPGALFDDRYRIERMLGAGGMGTVYKAHDQKVGIPIALKVIRPEVLSNPSTRIAFEKRFTQELLLARAVTHPNVLRIHDLGEVDGVLYITMPFVDGADLHGMLRTGPLPFERVLSLGRQIASGLAAAHEAGVIHRDLKPQNILVASSGHAYISDFGLAKSYEASASGLTRPGELLGTPRYMAPECVEGRATDHRSDLYALGLILYEMASGSGPFPGGGALEELLQHVRLPPRPLKEAAPEVPDFFTDIVMRCLEKDPACRYQHARDVLQDLERSAAPGPISSQPGQPLIERQPVSAWRRSRHAVLATGVVCLAGGLVVISSPVRGLIRGTSTSALTLPSPSTRKLIAVLPFRVQGTTQDMEQWDHIAAGLGEEMSAGLLRLNLLTVAAPNAIESVDRNLPHARMARALGSNLLVTGTLQGTGRGGGISVLMELEDLSAGLKVWSQEFSGDPGEALTLRDQMLMGLMAALSVTPTPDAQARALTRPTPNSAAYDLYLKGRYATSRQQDRHSLETAISFFNDALRQDPRFALAFAGLSDASVGMYHDRPDTKWATQAIHTAQEAKRLDDSLVEVHAALGQAYLATGRTQESIVELKRALEIAPNSDETYRRLAAAYRIAGQTDEAIKVHKLAIDKNPYYWVNRNALGYTYWRIGDYESAAPEFKKVIELEPDNVNGYNDLGAVYLQTGRYQDAADTLQKALKVGNTPDTWSNLGVAYAWMGRFAEALPAYQKAVEMNPTSDAWLSNLADDYRWLGDKEKAIETYDKAIGIALKALSISPNDQSTRASLGTYYAKKGDAAQAISFINAAVEQAPADAGYLYNLALAYALAHHNDQALDVLKKAVKGGYPRRFARDDPDFANLIRTDPRVRVLMQEVPPALKQ